MKSRRLQGCDREISYAGLQKRNVFHAHRTCATANDAIKGQSFRDAVGHGRTTRLDGLIDGGLFFVTAE